MSPKVGRAGLRAATARVLVGGGGIRSPFALRLDAREGGARQLFAARARSATCRGQPKLFHYISAGGMRQLRRTSADDLQESRRRSFALLLGALAALWLFFYLVPCA